MEKRFSGTVYDRALILDDPQAIKDFCDAPVDYIMDSGMYDGFGEFNGIWSAADSERMDNADGKIAHENYRVALMRAGSIHIIHQPAPLLDACKSWVIIIY